MEHEREDYNLRIQDAALDDASLLAPGATPIAQDEPVFLLRAQDKFAAMAVQFWAFLVSEHNPEKAKAALQLAEKMDAWPVKKIPGNPGA